MKLLARAENTLQASIWADTLRAAGIRCELRNTALSGALGEIPFLECAPQLWIEHDHDESRAQRDSAAAAAADARTALAMRGMRRILGAAIRQLLAMRKGADRLSECLGEGQ